MTHGHLGSEVIQRSEDFHPDRLCEYQSALWGKSTEGRIGPRGLFLLNECVSARAPTFQSSAHSSSRIEEVRIGPGEY